jgi:hypothetical protein
VQALARTGPVPPMMPGMPERRTHDYLRHGVTSLFAAFNIADGTVISAIHRRHRATEFKKFLTKIDSEVPGHLDIHLVWDNYGTHKTPAIGMSYHKGPDEAHYSSVALRRGPPRYRFECARHCRHHRSALALT